MKKNLPVLLFLHCVSYAALCQDFPYGHITSAELNMKKYDRDTSAHAVVLQEYGHAQINVANDDVLKVMFEYHVKIKIFDSKGFDEATKEIVLRNSDDNSAREEVEKITGATYITDENGAIKQVDFDPAKAYTTRDYKEQSTLKFTMPGLTNGCVIEYKYRFVSPVNLSLDHFHPWEFQSDIPKIYSEYEAVIPGHFTYNATLHGFLKLTKNDAGIERGCFAMYGSSSDCSDIKYGMSNIPAFVEEDYMTSTKNYISSISFDLVEYTNPYDGSKRKETKEWKDIDYSLKSSYAFGSQLKKKDVFKDRLVPVTIGKTNDLDKARAIYGYIQQWFKWNNYIGIYSGDGVKKAYESHSGSIADINLSLIDALNSAGINAQAVLISTRDNGLVNDLYPALNVFNYVVAKATIGDKTYLLDATDHLLPFGMLPLNCLNGRGRVFSMDNPSYWIDLDLPQREKSTVTMDLTLLDNGKLKGTLTRYSIGYEAFEKRAAIKKFNSIDEYVDNVYGKLPKIKVLKSEITNLDSLDLPVSEKYEVEINAFDKLNADKLSFNPFFLNWIKVNPFKLADRSYPVDMGMPSDDRIILTVHLPSQYSIETPPGNVSVALPNEGGKFLTSYQADNNSFTFSHIIQFNKSVYSPEEYPYLKELYNDIIKVEKQEMIFKKKL